MDKANYVRQCDSRWTLIGDKFCVKTSKDAEQPKMTWSESLSWCGQFGGVNLEVESAEIESKIRAYADEEFKEAESYKGVWLGITDLESANNQMVSYITQSEPLYQNWAYGEPSQAYSGARCTGLFGI